MPRFFVYLVKNIATGEAYVGRTMHPATRWRSHRTFARTGRGFLLHRAMRSQGEENFQFEIVSEFGDLTAAMADEARIISEILPAYNSTGGGDDILEVAMASVEARRQRSITDPDGEFQRNRARGLKASANTPPEVKRLAGAKTMSRFSADERRASAERMTASLTAEQRRAKAQKANETLGPEGRKARSRKAMNTLGADGLSARAKKTVQAQTAEQRSEARRRSWVTRRENRVLGG